MKNSLIHEFFENRYFRTIEMAFLQCSEIAHLVDFDKICVGETL
ncbi:hypothetical protein [Flavobacterium ardleyense]|nr:hypothetical protein [Flavobacterium ardleyense]